MTHTRKHLPALDMIHRIPIVWGVTRSFPFFRIGPATYGLERHHSADDLQSTIRKPGFLSAIPEKKLGGAGAEWRAVWKMVEDSSSMLWFASDSSIVKLDPRTNAATRIVFSHDVKKVSTLALDNAGDIWLGCNNGLYRFDPSAETLTFFSVGVRIEVDGVFLDSEGVLWVGTMDQGVYRFDLQTEQLTDHFKNRTINRGSLSSNAINRFYEDREGNLWIGTKNGIDQFNPQQTRFSHYRDDPDIPETLSHGNIQALDGDTNGNVWIGNGHTLDRFETKSGKFSHHSPPSNRGTRLRVDAVHCDRQGDVWFGLRDTLYQFEPLTKKYTEYRLLDKHPETGPPIGIDAVYKDRKDVIWLAVSHRGLYRVDRKNGLLNNFWINPGPTGPKTDATIKSLHEDAKKNL